MISIYDLFMKPLEKRGILKARKELIPRAKGHVLEIGSGTGANVKHYDFESIKQLIITDKKLHKKLKNLNHQSIKVEPVDVHHLPFDDDTFDYIVHTLVFCSVTDVTKGIQELKRVLKPNGSILFIEHILPEKKKLKRVFQFLNPAWKVIAFGCNLTRDYENTLITNGFIIKESSKFMNTVFIYGEAILTPESKGEIQ